MEVDQTQVEWHSGELWDKRKSRCIRWKVPIRYQNLTYISHGAFGVVMQATDTKTKKTVAIKRLTYPFNSAEHCKRTYRELKLLQHVNHDKGFIVQLYNVFTPTKEFSEFNEIYFVLNFVNYDLHRVIDKKLLPEDHISQIIYSILCGLKYLHSANIIHRDITPKNIGITKKSDVYILDLGLSRVVPNDLGTRRVVALHWRAPEVMVKPAQYTSKLDIWSVGCIMAELILGFALFPGKDSESQLEEILKVLGTPKDEDLERLCIEEKYQQIKTSMGNFMAKDFHTLFPTLSENGIEFLKSLLDFDPDKRPTAEQALEHPFCAQFRDQNYEFVGVPLTDPHEDQDHTVEAWKKLTWDLIQGFTEPTWALRRDPEELVIN